MALALEYIKTVKDSREYYSFWQRRYYSYNINSEKHLLQKLEYLHENPVRQGLIEDPAEYKWSSASWYLSNKSVGVKIDPGM